MFTGIVEETGAVHRVRRTGSAIELTVLAHRCGRALRSGDSLAVNGCCLTAVHVAGRAGSRRVRFDLLRETWERTNLRFVRAGSLVNLERSLPAHGRLHGHFVTGHIDGVGRIVRCLKAGPDRLLEIAAPRDIMRLVVFKGAIAVDGISLTVAAVGPGRFRVWIIPHTYAVTALPERKTGDAVNLETDILGKYAERFVREMTRSPAGRRAS